MKQQDSNSIIENLAASDYKYGFSTQIETDIIPVGLNEDIIRLISAKKNEPEWLLEFRLKAFRYWQKQPLPTWAHLDIPEIDFQGLSYYAATRKDAALAGFDDQHIYDEIPLKENERSLPIEKIKHSLAEMPFEKWKTKEDKTRY